MLVALLFETHIGDVLLGLFERLTGFYVEHDETTGWALCSLDDLPGQQ